ncbi:MAG: HisA/HisF-related TIM barrel protein [Zavarzinella sp.]
MKIESLPSAALIPVLDLRQGLAVQAVAGDRANYQPVESVLSTTTDPVELAQVMIEKVPCTTIYCADLDGIMHHRPQWGLLQRFFQLSVPCWVDLGICTQAEVQQVIELGGVPVIGLECTTGPNHLLELLQGTDPMQVIFSWDRKNGHFLHQWHQQPTLEELGEVLINQGLTRWIWMDLDRVGTHQGPDWEIVSRLVSRFPQAEITLAGGVRNAHDLQELATHGVKNALVASAIHRGVFIK